MNIKDYLKTVHITQKDLADQLLLSRPTLDAYIQQFQSDRRLSKDKYQVIFEQLFTDPPKSEDEFWKTLDKYSTFLRQEKALGTSEMNTTNSYILSLVTQELKKDLFKSDSNQDVYVFINLLIHNYRKNPFLMAMVDYFLLLYNRKDPAKISEDERIWISNLHDLIQKDNELTFKKESFNDLIEYTEKAKWADVQAKKELQQQLLAQIEHKMEQLSKAGIEIDTDNLDILSLFK